MPMFSNGPYPIDIDDRSVRRLKEWDTKEVNLMTIRIGDVESQLKTITNRDKITFSWQQTAEYF